MYIIATFPSRHYDIEEYPAVKDYLLSFGKERLEQTGKEYLVNGERVRARKKTNNQWFETQDSISYWEDFLKQKIVYPDIMRLPRTDDKLQNYPYFYLDENGRGLSVSLNEGEEVWDKSRRLNDIASIANLDENESNFIYGAGLSQTQALIFASGDDARAAYWCTMQGEGWYLPSCGELLTLINMSKEGSPVANTLRLLNVGTIDGWYWSSSEHDKKEALNVSSTGRVSTEEKKEKVKVRAIKTFTIK